MTQLDSLLTFWQFWRRIGEDVLVGGLVVDLLVAIFLHERKPHERIGEVIAVVLIIVGVVLENVAGGQADDVIRRMRAPRMLTHEQQVALAVEMHPFAGQQFSLAVTPMPEPVALIDIIDRVVDVAGWHVIDPQMPGDVSLGKAVEVVASGVKIQFAPNSSPETVRRAKLLAATLTDDNVPAAAELNPQLRNISALNILVGTKE